MTDICYPENHNLLSVEQALQNIKQTIAAITEGETIDLTEALGRILAEGIVSPIDIPPQRNAAMDGYAFAASDIAAGQVFTLETVGTSWAGQPYSGALRKGQCVRIFTGAVLPDQADSVIAQEQIKVADGVIKFPSDCQPFKNIRAAGSDVRRQEILVGAPKKLNACDISLLAAAGIENVSVKRKLKIGFFSTGDELSPLGQPLAPGKIYDSNRYLLAGLLADANHTVCDLGIVADNPAELEYILLAAASQYDVVISTGGASVGDADFVKQILKKCGQVNFWKLAIKPGKPLAYGRVGQAYFFGLPGNPVAVLVTYRKFVKPALEQLAGIQSTRTLQVVARCESRLKKSPGRQEYQRGILEQTVAGEFSVRLAGQQDSHQLKVASLANCFIVLEADSTGVEPGQQVVVEPFATLI